MGKPPYDLALTLIGSIASSDALDWLERAHEAHPGFVYLKVEPRTIACETSRASRLSWIAWRLRLPFRMTPMILQAIVRWFDAPELPRP